MVAFVAAAALLGAPAALAKGPSGADINGPGTGGGIHLGGNGEGGTGTPLGDLVTWGGFFDQAYGADSFQPRSRPKGDLGPRYRVVYTLPGPDGTSTLRQDVYPYARPTPVTYMAPGQRFFGGQQSLGGWYVASTALRTSLVAAGLPARTPDTGGSGWWPAWAIAAAVLVFAALAAATVRSPRGARSDRSPAPRRRARDRLLPAGDRGRAGAA